MANDKDRVFHDILEAEGWGGRYDYENSHNDESLNHELIVSTITNMANSFRVEQSNSSINPGCVKEFPDLYVGIADISQINACVFKVSDTYYMAVSRGAILLLMEAFSRLLSRPDVFSWIGDISKEKPIEGLPPVPRDSSRLLGERVRIPAESYAS